MSIHPRDILFYGGGAALQKYGTLTRRTTPIARNGEDAEETFARSGTVGTYVDRAGVIHHTAANVPRVNAWDTVNGAALTTPRLLLEDARTNLITDSEVLGGGGWSNDNNTVGTNADTAPDAETTADRIIEDSSAAVGHGIYDAVTKTASTNCAFSAFCKAGSRTWVRLAVGSGFDQVHEWFNLSTGAVGTYEEEGVGSYERSYVETYGDDWYRCVLVCDLGAVTSVNAVVALATGDENKTYNGDGSSYISAWGGQFEDEAEFASSYIQTSSGTATRNAETLSFPFPAPPQNMSVYRKSVERGTVVGDNYDRAFQLGQDTSTGRLIVSRETGANNYYTTHLHRAAGDNVSCPLSGATQVNISDSLELLLDIQADGKVTLSQSIDEGAQESGTQSGANPLPSSFGTGALYLAADYSGASHGFEELEALIVTRGSHSLADFRALLP